jgi:hypothetical protein
LSHACRIEQDDWEQQQSNAVIKHTSIFEDGFKSTESADLITIDYILCGSIGSGIGVTCVHAMTWWNCRCEDGRYGFDDTPFYAAAVTVCARMYKRVYR